MNHTKHGVSNLLSAFSKSHRTVTAALETRALCSFHQPFEILGAYGMV